MWVGGSARKLEFGTPFILLAQQYIEPPFILMVVEQFEYFLKLILSIANILICQLTIKQGRPIPRDVCKILKRSTQ